jgi:hypothetical protein
LVRIVGRWLVVLRRLMLVLLVALVVRWLAIAARSAGSAMVLLVSGRLSVVVVVGRLATVLLLRRVVIAAGAVVALVGHCRGGCQKGFDGNDTDAGFLSSVC